MSDLGPVFLFLKARKLDKIPAWSSILPNEISSKNNVTPLLMLLKLEKQYRPKVIVVIASESYTLITLPIIQTQMMLSLIHVYVVFHALKHQPGILKCKKACNCSQQSQNDARNQIFCLPVPDQYSRTEIQHSNCNVHIDYMYISIIQHQRFKMQMSTLGHPILFITWSVRNFIYFIYSLI